MLGHLASQLAMRIAYEQTLKVVEHIQLAEVANNYGTVYSSRIRREGHNSKKVVDEAIEVGESGRLAVQRSAKVRTWSASITRERRSPHP